MHHRNLHLCMRTFCHKQSFHALHFESDVHTINNKSHNKNLFFHHLHNSKHEICLKTQFICNVLLRSWTEKNTHMVFEIFVASVWKNFDLPANYNFRIEPWKFWTFHHQSVVIPWTLSSNTSNFIGFPGFWLFAQHSVNACGTSNLNNPLARISYFNKNNQL